MEALSGRGLSRPLIIVLAAVVLLAITVALGATLGLATRVQFREIEQSWAEYSGGTERKAILISNLRGHLGYGGIIHNFKNYVLRREPSYLETTRTQMQRFYSVIAEFQTLNLSAEEARALDTILAAIRTYEAKLPIAIKAAQEGWDPERTDALVRVDDSAAVAALHDLEQIWKGVQISSSRRIGAAVTDGQYLIWLGFMSIFALVIVALLIGWFVFLLVRNLHGAVSDLAAQLAERRRLESSESRLATAVEQSPATIIITDTDARIEYVNAKFEELTGWSRDEIRGQTPAFLQSGETSPQTYNEIRASLAEGQTWHGIFRNRKRDGASYWTETTILPLLAKDGTTRNFIAIGEDITEKRHARDQVVRAQKLEAVGQLASGVAHDFNNILTTIVGSSHLAAMDAPGGSDLAAEVAQIQIAARRAQSLVRELLTFARREPGQKKPVIVGAIVAEVAGLLRASVPPFVRIVCAPRSDDLAVLGDPTHLHQILMNLCRNAAEAMSGNPGTITVFHEPCGPPENQRARPDGWVRLCVSDDGPGMTAETQAHLFEPFFTTKPIGKGSGLGLAVVYGLVDDMGGQIAVESALGKGSRFTLILPRAFATAGEAIDEHSALPRGTERLILIDDEAEVAGTFRRLLLRLGYKVEAFTAPLQALERFRQDPARFDLVISDMVMPEMSGEVLMQQFRALRPHIPVLFCSGYKPHHIDLPGAEPEVLDKPVEPGRLARSIRALLDR
ncbi:hybrid sensor histidine kinase/response regulator [Oricola cellulosilytica]|uniref:histidine kinase n=1 Tax=Oricola cellulosilytica TaxID=1429082 RepID=A0A4R0P9I1_9HYPH|nr:ATP-binding protein [Oricola cellulosilytica]TCD13829.1 PAS domain S-box protein [Oricola cellulosilytica]